MTASIRRRGILLSAAMILLGTAALSAQENQLVLTRGKSTIVLEPYAPNILRVTLSLNRALALAAPGFGVVATPAASGWSASQTKLADIYKSASLVASVERPQSPPWDDSASFLPCFDSVGRISPSPRRRARRFWR